MFVDLVFLNALNSQIVLNINHLCLKNVNIVKDLGLLIDNGLHFKTSISYFPTENLSFIEEEVCTLQIAIYDILIS